MLRSPEGLPTDATRTEEETMLRSPEPEPQTAYVVVHLDDVVQMAGDADYLWIGDRERMPVHLAASAPALLAALKSDRILIGGLLERLDDLDMDMEDTVEWLLGVQRPLMRHSRQRSIAAIAKVKA